MAEEKKEFDPVYIGGQKITPGDVEHTASGRYWKQSGLYKKIVPDKYGGFEIEGVGKFEKKGSYFEGKDKEGNPIRIDGDPSFLPG